MDSATSALFGAAIGALSGLVGPAFAASLQARRDRAKWILDNRKTAYVDAIKSFSRTLNFRSEPSVKADAVEWILKQDDIGPFFSAIGDAQAAISNALLFCSEKETQKINGILTELTSAIMLTYAKTTSLTNAATFSPLYTDLVACARRDLGSATGRLSL